MPPWPDSDDDDDPDWQYAALPPDFVGLGVGVGEPLGLGVGGGVPECVLDDFGLGVECRMVGVGFGAGLETVADGLGVGGLGEGVVAGRGFCVWAGVAVAAGRGGLICAAGDLPLTGAGAAYFTIGCGTPSAAMVPAWLVRGSL
jgi:hypothetical protein